MHEVNRSWHSCFIFVRSRVKISLQRLVIPTEIFRVFLSLFKQLLRYISNEAKTASMASKIITVEASRLQVCAYNLILKDNISEIPADNEICE
jgi:hypothetical protein